MLTSTTVAGSGLAAITGSKVTLTFTGTTFTGTPDGVGAARGRFLKAGELIRSGAEVIGELSNRCVEAAR